MRLWIVFLFLALGQTLWASSEFVDSPAQCFQKKVYPCRLRASVGFLSFEKGSQKFHLGEKSSLLLNSESEIQLLEGQVWIKDSSDLTVKSTSALRFTVSGEWFLEKNQEAQLVVRNLGGDIHFQSKYVFANEALPIGFQNWYGALDSTGQVSRGVIRPIGMTEFLRAWLPISGLSIAEARKASHEYIEHWGNTLERSADLYQEIVDRRLASHENKIREVADRKKAQVKEQQQLRQMYREKNGL